MWEKQKHEVEARAILLLFILFIFILVFSLLLFFQKKIDTCPTLDLRVHLLRIQSLSRLTYLFCGHTCDIQPLRSTNGALPATLLTTTMVGDYITSYRVWCGFERDLLVAVIFKCSFTRSICDCDWINNNGCRRYLSHKMDTGPIDCHWICEHPLSQ